MGFWKSVNAPMSERVQDIVATTGLLLFGLSGFIDRADGRRFGWIKILFLALGVIALLKMLVHGRLMARDKHS